MYRVRSILSNYPTIFKVSTDYLLCVAKTQTLDLTGLDEEDITVLYALATHLRRKNREMKL